MALVAGVDSSTQSTKVEIRDAETGRLVAAGSAPHPATGDPARPGLSEADPEGWWNALRAALAAAVDDATRQGALGSGERIAAVSVAAQQHGMVALDAAGHVIRPAKLWNDTETAPDSGWLMKQLPEGRAAWAEACGSVPVASFTIAKLSWLHRSEPEAWKRLAHVLLPHDWLTYRLTGELVTDRGDASGTGYWNAATGDYRFDLLSIVDKDRDWSAVVPRVLRHDESAGVVTSTRAPHPVLEGAIVGPGTGDNMGVSLGVALRPGDAVISVGTSVTAFTVSEHAVTDPSGAVAGFADATGRHLPLVCLLNGTKVLDAVARLIGLDPAREGHEELARLALAAPLGAAGVGLLPYFDGERTPDLPASTGAIAGLRSGTTREHVARAAVEGVVCSALEALDALRAHAPVTGRVLLVGGGSRSPAVRQVFAELCDLPVDVLAEDQESVAAGAALQAASILHDVDVMELGGVWGLGRRLSIDTPPVPDDDRSRVRAAHRELRHRMTS